MIPFHPLVVEQDPHQLGNRQGRMRVVQVDGHLVRERLDVRVADLEAPDDILQRAGHEEILLLETKLLALLDAVVRIQDLRNVFRQRFAFVGLDVIAVVEKLEIEFLRGLGRPEPQVVHRVVAVAGDRKVVGNPHYRVIIDPARDNPPRGIALVIHPPAEAHLEFVFRPLDFPGIPVAQPVVRLLHLKAVLDALPENPVIVPDPVAVARQLHRRQRIQKAGREPPETAVAQPGVALDVADDIPIEPEVIHHLAHVRVQPQVDHVVAHRAADEVLHREVVHPFYVLLVVRLAGLDPPLDQPVAHGHRQRHVAVVVRGRVLVLGQRVLQMILKTQLERFDRPQLVVIPGQVRKRDIVFAWRRVSI